MKDRNNIKIKSKHRERDYSIICSTLGEGSQFTLIKRQFAEYRNARILHRVSKLVIGWQLYKTSGIKAVYVHLHYAQKFQRHTNVSVLCKRRYAS